MTTNKNEKLLISSFMLVVIMMLIGSFIVSLKKIDLIYVILSIYFFIHTRKIVR